MEFGDYLKGIVDPQQRSRVETVLDWVRGTFPQLEPRVAWNQPMFTDHGTFIVGFSVSKKHLAMSPELRGIEVFSDRIRAAGFGHTKMLVQFPWEKPVDFGLLEEMIAFNIAEKADTSSFWRK